ncbi:hypothetical protein [Levilactobacillus bambusae]|uniref:Glycosyltransferase RgtA/B/C/D-like domain-containing protein n=1 Tax=Levilactobacillus bambusae TaxID=2024736 RepID=A0A2V1MYW7_9LACO|nr:hypothetical protein [Levilactobacillus bambusae]PWG00157.1 hypothetical protein DCM90_04280 [Levilactobacillus bambusae]
MGRISRIFLVTALFGIGLILVGIAGILALFKPINFLAIHQWVSPLTLLFCSVILFILLRGIWLGLNHLSPKQLRINMIIVTGLLLLCQLWVATHFEVSERADLYYVREQAINLFQGHTKWLSYFYVYSNNVNAAIFLSWWNRLAHWIGLPIYGTSIYVAQFLWLDVGLACAAWMLKRVRGLAGSIIFLLLCLVSVPLYYYALYIYTDTVVFPTTLISLAIIMKLTSAKRWQPRLFWTILLGLIVTFATLVKMNFLILLIAIIIGLALTVWPSHANWQMKTLVIVVLVAIMGIGFRADGAIKTANHYQLDEHQVMPLIHWIDMSWNPEQFGNYSRADTAFLTRYPSKEQKVAIESNQLKTRIHKMGSKGVIKHLYRKTRLFLATGDFDIFRLYGPFQKAPTWYLSRQGTLNWVLAQWCQVLYLVMLFATLLFGLTALKRHQVNHPIAIVAVLFLIGMGIFHIFIWETEERYALPLLAVWLVSGTMGLTRPVTLSDHLEQPSWLRPGILIGCLLISAMCYDWDRPVFTTQLPYQRGVLSQTVGNYYKSYDITLKPGHSITQRFKVPLAFNVIKLGNNDESAKQMRFTVYNGAHKRLYQRNGQGQKIHFKKSLPAGSYQLTLTNRSKKPLLVSVGIGKFPLITHPLNGFKTTYLRFSAWESMKRTAVSRQLYTLLLGLFTLVGLALGWRLTRKK